MNDRGAIVAIGRVHLANQSMRPSYRSAHPRWIVGRGLTILLLSWLATSTGCMVGPNFQRPKTEVPATWTGPTPSTRPQPATVAEPTGAEKKLALWWTVFDDQTLTSLVKRAVKSNLDIKLTEARIRQARAARGVAASGLGPTLDAASSFQRSHSPGVTATGSNSGTSGTTQALTLNQYQLGFDAAWELDIFGGVRRGIEAAEADLQASVEDRRDVLVTLTAEVALNYINLRTFQQRIAIAQENLKAQEHTAELTHKRFRFGFVSGLDVANADAQVSTTAAEIPLLEASARQSIYSLSILSGLPPGALVQELSPSSAIPTAPPSVPVGLPSDLLRRRPDIRRAEAEIHSATARIGVATADLFPKFTISGSTGLLAGDLSSWFNWAAGFWSLGSSLSWTAFDTGRTRANIEVQKALEEQSLITYQQTVLTALQEVESALIASSKEQEHRKALTDAVAANRKAVNLATKLYVEGQTDFLNVLDAQRSLYATEDSLVLSTGTVSTNLVALYKALGGGWEAESPPR
jgi:multidrug efflux system outer membrane protein